MEAAGNSRKCIPEWLEDFTENLEIAEVLAPEDVSHDSDWERQKMASRKHSISTHFRKDQNGEVCMRTKITRALCRRRIGDSVPRAENFGDLITADHKLLRGRCESRKNLPYAVVVQDLATQWIQSYRCMTKTSQETEQSLRTFFRPV